MGFAGFLEAISTRCLFMSILLFGSTTIATFTIYVFISVPSYMRFANATCDDILLNFKMNGTASSSDCEYTIPNQSFLDQVFSTTALMNAHIPRLWTTILTIDI